MRLKTWHWIKLKCGLIVTSFLLLGACASPQRANVNVIPDYTPEFLEQVADEYDAEKYGPATKVFVGDYAVIVEKAP